MQVIECSDVNCIWGQDLVPFGGRCLDSNLDNIAATFVYPTLISHPACKPSLSLIPFKEQWVWLVLLSNKRNYIYTSLLMAHYIVFSLYPQSKC